MAKFGIGQAVRRVEDVRFLKGAGCFVDDMTLPGELHGVVVYSTHAHARIRRVDTSAAQAAPGVVLVLSGADAVADQIGSLPPLFMPEDMGGPKGFRTHRPILAHEVVRCVGDRVAFVVAESEAEARDAADLDRDRLRYDAGRRLGRGCRQAWRAAGVERMPDQHLLHSRIRRQGGD